MMSLLVIFAETICSLATFLWAFFVRNITDMDYTKSTSIYFNNVTKHGCSIQIKNKMKNFALIGLLFTEGCYCVLFSFLDTDANAYSTVVIDLLNEIMTLKHEKHGNKPDCNV